MLKFSTLIRRHPVFRLSLLINPVNITEPMRLIFYMEMASTSAYSWLVILFCIKIVNYNMATQFLNGISNNIEKMVKRFDHLQGEAMRAPQLLNITD